MATIRRALKKDLGLNYLKAYKITPKVTNRDNIKRLCENAILLHSMNAEGVKLIYFEKFFISSRHLHSKIGASKRQQGFIDE